MKPADESRDAITLLDQNNSNQSTPLSKASSSFSSKKKLLFVFLSVGNHISAPSLIFPSRKTFQTILDGSQRSVNNDPVYRHTAAAAPRCLKFMTDSIVGARSGVTIAIAWNVTGCTVAQN